MATRRNREQFQFTTVELATLAVSFTATSVLVFLLGFYVGRRAAAEHAGVAEAVARVPVGEAPVEPGGLTDSALAPMPAAKAPATTAKPATAPKMPAPPAAAAPATKAPAVPPLPPLPPAAATPPPPSPQAATDPQSAPPGVPFTVQVLATRNRGEADSLAGDLKRRGYGAYVAALEDAGGTWYRVRIGHFENAEAARRMAERATRDLGLTQAYVSPIYSNAR